METKIFRDLYGIILFAGVICMIFFAVATHSLDFLTNMKFELSLSANKNDLNIFEINVNYFFILLVVGIVYVVVIFSGTTILGSGLNSESIAALRSVLTKCALFLICCTFLMSIISYIDSFFWEALLNIFIYSILAINLFIKE